MTKVIDMRNHARSGFNGEHIERGTGYYMLGNGYRAYSPILQRLNSPDSWSPFGQGGLNFYAYCEGDPVNEQDPSGHSVWMNLFLRHELRRYRSLNARVPKPVQPKVVPISRTLPDAWPESRPLANVLPSTGPAKAVTGKNYEGIFADALLQKLRPVELAEMRLLSSRVQFRIDVYSSDNLRKYRRFYRLSDFPRGHGEMETTLVETLINVAGGFVPGVAVSQASKEMSFRQAKGMFARDHQGSWDVLAGTRYRRESFEGVPLRLRRIRGS